ncbi:ArnT family glycosyltransferase [Candidatus Omnitrophota bacterium]
MNKKDLFFWIAIITAIVLCRIQYIFMPIIDHFEALFSFVTSSVMDGAKLYEGTFSQRPPLVYLPYHIIFSIFGRNNLFAIHIAALVWAVFIAITVFKMSRYAFNKSVAYWATFFFAIFHTTINYDGQNTVPSSPNCMTLNAEFMLLLPLSVSFYMFLKGIKEKKCSYFVLTGLFCGISAMLHFKVLLYLLFLPIYLVLISAVKEKSRPIFAKPFKFTLFITLGVILGVGVGLLYFSMIGSWPAITKHYSHQLQVYVGGAQYLTPQAFKRFFILFSEMMVKHNFLLWFLAFFSSIYSLLSFLKYCKKRDISAQNRECDFAYSNLFFSLWLIFSLLTLFLHGARMFRQYWTLCFPVVMIIAAYGLYVLKTQVLARDNNKLFWASKIFLYSFLILGILVPIYSTHIRGFPLVKKAYGFSKYPILEYIRKNTEKDDRIFLWGALYPVYVLSDRIPASPFVFNAEWFGLIIDVPVRFYEPTKIIWEMFEKRFNEKKPKLIIDPSQKNKEPKDTYGPFLWGGGRWKGIPSVTEVLVLKDYVAKDYKFVEEYDGFLIYKLKEGR